MTVYAITGGALWDGTGAAPVPNSTVLIEGRRITAAGPGVQPPEGAELIDAAGKTVMPGLIDMHVHVMLSGEQDALYGFLGTGVTSVRDLGSDLDITLPMREQIAAGERIGPRLFVYGPMNDGTPTIFGDRGGGGELSRLSTENATPEQGVATIERLIGRGVDGIKLYAGLRPDVAGPMIEAVAGRVPVTGHLGRMWASEAIDLGINCLEHVHATVYQDVVRPEDRHGREDGNGARPDYWQWLTEGWSRADLDADYVQRFIEQIVEHDVALSPTTVLITGGMATNEAAEEPGQRYRPRALAERTRQRQEMMQRMREEADREGREPPPTPRPVDPETGRRALEHQLEFLRRVHAAGGRVLPGTDTGAAPLQVAGFALHRELALLVRGGIAASDVLQAATRQAAEFLGRGDDLGTIAVGKLADVLIVDGDPLTDIEASRRVVTVFQDGVRHDPQALLDRIEVAE